MALSNSMKPSCDVHRSEPAAMVCFRHYKFMCSKCVQENVHVVDDCNPKAFHKIVTVADVMINEFLILKQEALVKRAKVNTHIDHVQKIEKNIQNKINEFHETVLARLQKLKENTDMKLDNLTSKMALVYVTEENMLKEADASIDEALQNLLSTEESENDFSKLHICLNKVRSIIQENSVAYEPETGGGFAARDTFKLGSTFDSEEDLGNVWLSDSNPYELVEAKASKVHENVNFLDNSYMDCTCTCTDCTKNGDTIRSGDKESLSSCCNKETCTNAGELGADSSSLIDIKEHSKAESGSELLRVVHKKIGSNIRRVINKFGKHVSNSLRPASKDVAFESTCQGDDQSPKSLENTYITPVFALKHSANASSNIIKHKKLSKNINSVPDIKPLVNNDTESTY